MARNRRFIGARRRRCDRDRADCAATGTEDRRGNADDAFFQALIAEGAAATGVAAALSGMAGSGRIACVVSGGNIDAVKLAMILNGGTPA